MSLKKNKKAAKAPDTDTPSDTPQIAPRGQEVPVPLFEEAPLVPTDGAPLVPTDAEHGFGAADEAPLFRPPAATTAASPALADLTTTQLIALRHEIDKLLPATTFSELDVEQELLLQYALAKELMNDTHAGSVPANQKAQVLNACSGVLETLSRTQATIFNAERVKAMEAALEKAFQGVSVEIRTAFYDRYEELLRLQVSQKKAKK